MGRLSFVLVVGSIAMLGVGSPIGCGGKLASDEGSTSADAGSSAPSPVQPDAPSTSPTGSPSRPRPPPPLAIDAGPVDAGIDGSPCIPPARPAVGPIPAMPTSAPVHCGSKSRGAYLVSNSANFYAFDPSTMTATKLGALACATTGSPFTLAVTDEAAYVLYTTAEIHRVDLDTLACSFFAQLGTAYGMSAPTSALPNSLLFYGLQNQPGVCGAVPTLSRFDLTTKALEEIGPVTPTPAAGYPLELRVDAYGRAFTLDAGGTLLMIDSTTAALLGRNETGIAAGSSNALLIWNDRLLAFTRAEGMIDEYGLADRKRTPRGNVGEEIVGAAAPPCIH